MGLFFSTSSSKKVFKTSKEVRRALVKISSLTREEKNLIYPEIVRELDDGGVTVYEGREKLNQIFYKMMKEGRISSTDYQNLKKLWK